MRDSEQIFAVPEKGSMLFLSDVHLGSPCVPTHRDLQNELVLLLNYCEKHEIKLVLLGDFFDYWMEYPRHHPPLGQTILEAFNQYHRRTGNRTLFITGNHDNWTGAYLPGLGFDLEHEYRILQTDAGKLLLLHGDGLGDARMRLPRPIMHRILRNAYFVSLYQKLFSPDSGIRLMKWYSSRSRKTKTRNDQELIQLQTGRYLEHWARQHMEEHPELLAVVCGHSHRPALCKTSNKFVVNTGSYLDHRSLGLYTNGLMQIVIWDAEVMQLRGTPWH